MSAIQEKARLIRLLVIDIDGVLTNGIIFYGNNNLELKGFHTHDGLGLKLLKKTGVEVGVISAKHSEAVTRRLNDLEVIHTYFGYGEKLPAYADIKRKLDVKDHEIAYMGDDLPDLPILLRAGLAITVPAAPAIIRQHVDLITEKNGGMGAVREACEFIMQAQNTYQTVIDSFLNAI